MVRRLTLLPLFSLTLLCCSDSADPPVRPLLSDASDASSTDVADDAPTGVDANLDVAPDAPKSVVEACDGVYSGPVNRGVIEDEALLETSGLASSTVNPDVIWAHNDSGDSARLFALGVDGRAIARLTLAGVTAVDFEDLARGPCPDGQPSCLWVGDIGDNDAVRDAVAVYAAVEPTLDLETPATVVELTASQVWAYPISYPAGAMNAEALLVAPDGSSFTILEKSGGDTARVFVHPTPLVAGTAAEMIVAAEIRSPGLITGADLHPSGERLLLRTYASILEYQLGPRGLANIASVPGLEAGSVSEPQGEAIAYDASGKGFWTLSENAFSGRNQPLYHWECAR